jgi:divalent metal cation (Fe/Co/Zn/Cd) transporter
MYSLALIIFVVSEKKAFEHFPIGFYNLKVFSSDMKFKMVATAGFSLTLDPMGKMFQNASSLKPLTFMYSLALIIFVVSEKKAFEHFRIGSNVNLCPAVVAILDFRSA